MRSEAIQAIVEQVVNGMGYTLWGMELRRGARHATLRVYIDQDDGITLDDCTRVSHQLSGALDVEDPINVPYSLEVSSPGMDRPLFEASHYEQLAGQNIRLRLGSPVDGRRKFKGRLLGLADGIVKIEEDGAVIELPLADIDAARLEPEW
jgi:ribosome maturation factor RimP